MLQMKQGLEKVDSCGKENLYIAASLQFSLIAFDYSWIVY